MKITLTAELYRLDENVFRTVVEAFIKQEMTKAVKEFLLASLVRIPARTGFLRGSFTDIARAFNAGGTGAGAAGYSSKQEYYYTGRRTRILKTPRSGIKFATLPDQVLKRRGDQILFELESKISYFQANDTTPRIPGAPWNSSKEGYAAMISYLEGSPGRFPRIDALLTKLTIQASTNVTQTSQAPDVGAILATRQLLIEGF